MTPSNSMCEVPNYGSSASYCDLPSPEQIRAGVVPLDSLPAAWWNAMWACTNGEVNKARDMLGQLITELNNVLCNAGVCACSSCTDQLYQSINKIRQTLANATVAGAVKSSSQPSEIAVDVNGYMSVNCLGNAASLTTSASTVVGAINELKSTYDCCVGDINTALGNKAPTSHASSATTYGVGNADNYGHLKISDTYTSVLTTCSGVAASQMAVACVYEVAAAAAAGNVALGSTAGCALGTAAAGTATTSARSDHVHPLPSKTDLGLGTAAECAASDFRACTWTPSCVARAGYATCLYNRPGSVANGLGNVYFYTGCTDASCTASNYAACICGVNGCLYGIGGINLGVTCATGCKSAAIGSAACTDGWSIYGHVGGSDQYNLILNLTDDGSNYVGFACNGTVKSCICGSDGKFYGLAACASANGSGTAFGDAATRGVFTRTAVGDIGWATTTNRTKVVDVGAMAYWNGAYQDTASNLRYYCGGAFGSAAACAASCFRASTWWPNSTSCGCVCCSDQAKKASCVSMSWAHSDRNYRIPLVDCAFACTGVGDKPLAQSVCCCQLLFNPVYGILSITNVNGTGTGTATTINAECFTGIACCAYTACSASRHKGVTCAFPNNCNKQICGVRICCYNCCNGCVCFFNCTCSPKLVTYARYTSNGYSRGGFLLPSYNYSCWAGECWGWAPACNCFTIYEFSAT